MNAFVFRRLLGAIPLLLGVSVLSFIFMQLAPGGPDTLLAKNGRMTQSQLNAIRHNLGLDESVPRQLWIWIVNLFQGDLGTSFSQQRPVRDVIMDVFPNTLYLMIVAIIISLLIAIIFGVGGALNQYGWFDNVTSFVAYFGLSMPVFWFGLMLQILFAVKLGWLPSANMHSPTGNGAVDLIRHMILPATTLAIGGVGSWSRYSRSSTLEVLGQDYVRTARAKGLREQTVMVRHVFRNALIPFVTVIAIDIPLYLTGAVVTETVFSWPGMGRLFFDSLGKRDYPVLMGVLLLGAVLIVLGNLIADVMYAVLDPTDFTKVSAAESTLATIDPRGMQQVQTRPMSPWRVVWRRLRRSRSALAGTIIFGLVVVLSSSAALIAPFDKNDIDLFNITGPASRSHWLGTDGLGRDELTRLLYGGQYSLLIGVGSAVIAITIGIVVGAVAGYYGGKVDAFLMRFVDLMLAFPSIFLLLIVGAILNGITVTNVILFLAAFGWMWLARIIRGEFLSMKEREYVEAARMIGVSSGRIIFRHLLPNVTGPIIVALTLDIALYILAEATLSFLGFGVKPETPTWGNMLNEARTYSLTHPLLVIAPGLTITFVVLAINYIGDGLRDAFDPKSGR